jgi:hypothetical protein
MDIIKLDSGATAGNANADFLVPAGVGAYQVLYGQVILTTNATVANRQFSFGIYDDTGTPVLIFDTHAGAVVPAGQTVHFELLPGIYRETAITAGTVQVPIPDRCLVRGGWTIRSLLSSGGQAADTFRVKLVVEPIGSRLA